MKAEVIHGTRFETEIALRRELSGYVRYYNHQRLHSALGYQSPVDYESCAA
ncbi:MAG: IS3 family transposase [Gemmatimonadota bacterium]|nr:IS3 family transposase [Gemmatimonadota bacterium]